MSWPLSILLHYVMGTHWACLDYWLFLSIMSWVLIGSVLRIVYFFLCHGYSLGCLDYCLFLSIMSWVLIGVSCQWYICLHYVMCTHWECHVIGIFLSIMSCVLFGSVLTIVYFSPLYHGYSLGVSWPLSISLHYIMGTHWKCLDHFTPLCHGYSLGVSWPLSISLHYIIGTHWECLYHCLFVSIISWVLIRSVFTIVYLSPLYHGYSLGVSLPLSICLHYVMGTHWGVLTLSTFLHHVFDTHWECPDTCLFVSIMSLVII